MKQIIMVCVTRQKTCERLIELGARLAAIHGGELIVAHAIRTTDCVLGNTNEAEALEYLFERASERGAEMMMVRNDDVAGSLVNLAKKHGATVVVVGATPPTEPVSFAARLRTMLPEVDVISVEASSFDMDAQIHISMNINE